MEASLQSLVVALDSNGVAVGPNRTCRLNAYMHWARPAVDRHAVRRRIQKKRRAILEGSRNPRSSVERRIRDLRRLVPTGESVGLDGLLSEAAEYIECLRMQVEVMQALVKVLSGDSDDEA